MLSCTTVGQRSSESGSAGEELASTLQDLGLESIPEPITFDLQIVACFEIQPKPLGRSEIPRKSKGRVGRYGSLSVNDFVDATRRNTNILR